MPDVWNGQPLPEQIHYRLYDQAGKLLSFNSTNSLASLAADIGAAAREYPGARINVVQYDGPAHR